MEKVSEGGGQVITRRSDPVSLFQVLEHNNMNYLGYHTMAGLYLANRLFNLDKRIGSAHSNHSRHCQLYKSAFEDNGLLPRCFKGFAVGMSDPD